MARESSKGRASARPFCVALRYCEEMKFSRQAGFAGLCVLSGSGWLLGEIYPSGIGFPVAGCIHFLLIALIATVFWVSSRTGGVSLWSAVTIALAGMGVFALPGIAAHMVAGAISLATSSAMFSAIALLTLVALKFLGSREKASSWSRSSWSRSLLGSVIGIGGVIVLLTADLPQNRWGWLNFALLAGCCAAIAMFGIWLYSSLQGVPVATAVSLAGFGSAALLAAGITTLPEISMLAVELECARCAVFDLPVVWLTAWLIREVSPGRMSARFILIPAVTALESFVWMRGGLDVRSGMAVAGMIVGGGLVLFGEETEEIASLHLR